MSTKSFCNRLEHRVKQFRTDVDALARDMRALPADEQTELRDLTEAMRGLRHAATDALGTIESIRSDL